MTAPLALADASGYNTGFARYAHGALMKQWKI